MVVYSFGREFHRRTFYAGCDSDTCEGTTEGPRRKTIIEAVRAYNAPLLKFSREHATTPDPAQDPVPACEKVWTRVLALLTGGWLATRRRAIYNPTFPR